MADGTTPGNGSTNPFTQGASSVPGNNFLTNPRGANQGGSGRRFDNEKSAPQAPRQSTADISVADAAPGGLIPMADAQQTPGKDIGVGSIGNAARPFKLDGGEPAAPAPATTSATPEGSAQGGMSLGGGGGEG